MTPQSDIGSSNVRLLHIWAVLIAASLVAGIWSGWSEWDASGFIPFNGHFQNYWSLVRISGGEVPFKDFPVYLGAAHLYAALPLFHALGADFRASTAVHNGLAGFTLELSLLVVCRLVGWRLPTSLCFSVVAFSILGSLATGWSSVLGFRSFLPVIVAGLVYVLPQPDTNRRSIAYGLLGGVLLTWSNDYGPAATIAMVMICLVRSNYLHVGRIAVTLVGCLVGIVVSTSIVSWGHPLSWLSSAILLPGSAQYWYFNPIAESKTYGLMDFPFHDKAFALSCILLCLLALTRYGRTGTLMLVPQKSCDPLIALLACAIGGFSLSCLAGTYETRYAIPLWRYAVPVMIAVSIAAAGWVLPVLVRRRYPALFSAHVPTGVACATLVAMQLGFGFDGFRLSPDMQRAALDGDMRPVHALGLSSWPEAAEAEQVGLSLAVRGLRLTSNYSSVVSAAANSLQAPLASYLIHAFGDEARARFVSRAAHPMPPGHEAWETLDHDLMPWGLWNIRMEWAVHRELFSRWHPTARTPWTLIWEPRVIPLLAGKATCEVVHAEGSRPELRVTTDAGNGATWWADVTADLETSFESGWLPLAGKVRLLDITEGEDALIIQNPGAVSLHRWTASLHDGPLSMPAMVAQGHATRLRLRSWPSERSSVRVTGCHASLVAPLQETIMRMARPMTIAMRLSADPFATTIESHVNGTRIIRMVTANPYHALAVEPGDDVLTPDGRTLHVLVKGFGSFICQDDGLGAPPPSSMVTAHTRERDVPLGVMDTW